MNLTRNPALIDQLAASYALGTLRGGARRRFEELARTHASVRAAALIWQGRMASVTELQAQQAPSPAVWKRIENLVQADKQARAMQAARQAPVVGAGGGWWASLGLWRGASAAGAMAAVVAVVTGLNLNTALNGQVQELSARLAATPEIRYVAVLADDKAAPAVLVTYDPKHSQLQLKHVGQFHTGPDKSLQLWALPQGGGPKSLGVLGEGTVIRLPAGSSDVNNVPALALSLEPRGGVPAGSGPSGPVLFKGALLQTAL
ncbi:MULTISPECIES: anti-sigma factor [unclassified Polaromonas]|jgi:anti-sigma-K factor RskA|uniref:anti-sigma factor n=1 Tax=unclassified Polaromonas TaxID=2638319 RepID=UPI000BC9B611|nr:MULTISPECIES: anti-sigma factor [unclassified Polaromonas]OYY37957.1 MAG: RNA polymerase subunit sigma-70 [Polaromonas sp. 35-63-35]OYZ21138.1 MAG: RNA polymerase subunit sigma-70 [Polaromonas sp. 16-63-31]OYZ79504.1 MAG: RNA polymerase subunit sigma-70 [Polaromonas sp. 24-63-21]OZA50650.1 MAG: RNA polymerase subunit sigma-70 [Polaromonas sp. 17-63-33]OZA89509.1 MAG: RNA polymerase subunit sigma-70 [Polaromonas sp. 39-63-25]